MANLTTSTDIDTFMGSADNAAARTNLGVLPLAGGTLTGQLIQSTNGAASTPPLHLSGTVFTGGSATTTKPQLLVEPTGATSTGWSTSGTLLGLNCPSGFVGNMLSVNSNGATVVRIDPSGGIQWNESNNVTALSRHGNGLLMALDNAFSTKFTAAEIRCPSTQALVWTDGSAFAGTTNVALVQATASVTATPILQLGKDAAPVTNQHFKACNRITSDGVGADLTISGGNGRGGAGGSLIFATYTTGAASTPGTLTTRLTIDGPNGNLTLAEAVDIYFGSTTGSRIGGAGSNKLSFWGKTPIIQPTNAITAAAFAANSSGITDDSATYGNYTMGQIAAALIDVGILA